jgi:hypothetical protein
MGTSHVKRNNVLRIVTVDCHNNGFCVSFHAVLGLLIESATPGCHSLGFCQPRCTPHFHLDQDAKPLSVYKVEMAFGSEIYKYVWYMRLGGSMHGYTQ